MSDQPAPISRRRFLKRIALLGGGAIAGASVLALLDDRGRFVVRRVTAPIEGLPPSLEGFTIGQISDLHRGPFVSERHVRRAAQLLMELKPQLIALTGDFISQSSRYAESCARALEGLEAPSGVFAVAGNHDHVAGWEPLADALGRQGVRTLTNARAEMNTDGARWWVVGVDDVLEGEPDAERALSGLPADEFKLTLWHEPDMADVAAQYGVQLQLSGHSHGGQIRLPGLGATFLPLLGRRYPAGLQRTERGPTQVYTNVGTGVVFPPYRLNCPPEVTLITLKRA